MKPCDLSSPDNGVLEFDFPNGIKGNVAVSDGYIFSASGFAVARLNDPLMHWPAEGAECYD